MRLRLALLSVWLVLFQNVTVGLLVGGAATVSLIVWLVPTRRDESELHPSPAAVVALAASVAVDVVRSTFLVARAAVSREPGRTSRVVRVELGRDTHVSTLRWTAALVTLVPGGYAVRLVPEFGVLDVHVLQGDDPQRTTADVRRLARRVAAALGHAPAGPAEEST